MGSKTEYVDVEFGFDPSTLKEGQLRVMDCITCHNRTAHEITSPDITADELISRDLVSQTIPEIKQKTVEVLSEAYADQQTALDAIAALETYYRSTYADFYAQNSDLVNSAIREIQAAYLRTNFPDQKVDWQTHPDNIGHIETPGCFRCHDGKHLTASKEAVRLECNICHSIPVATGAEDLVTNVEISRGPEPGSHQNSNWISLHGKTFDETCESCHSTADAGGTSNTSFCSNSLCHGAKYTFAGFDAPKLREILGIIKTATPEVTATQEATATTEPTSTVAPTSTKAPTSKPATTATEVAGQPSQVTYDQHIAPILKKCTGCHNEEGSNGVNLTSYQAIMQGGDSGPIVVPGDPENSQLVIVQSADKKHYTQLSAEELQTVIDWIEGGALEK